MKKPTYTSPSWPPFLLPRLAAETLVRYCCAAGALAGLKTGQSIGGEFGFPLGSLPSTMFGPYPELISRTSDGPRFLLCRADSLNSL